VASPTRRPGKSTVLHRARPDQEAHAVRRRGPSTATNAGPRRSGNVERPSSPAETQGHSAYWIGKTPQSGPRHARMSGVSSPSGRGNDVERGCGKAAAAASRLCPPPKDTRLTSSWNALFSLRKQLELRRKTEMNRKWLQRAVGVVAPLIAAVGLLATSVPAASASAEGVAAMTGTISPDILMTLGGSFTMSATGTVAMVVGNTPRNCNIDITVVGSETVVTGSFSGTLSCNGNGVAMTCTINGTIVGTIVTMSGSCAGTPSGSLAARCHTVFVPNPTNNTDIVGMHCEMTIV
jgi:hypothetical protein